MPLQSFFRFRHCGLFAAALLSAGCATTGNGAGEESVWQKMIPGNQAAVPMIPAPAQSKYLQENEVHVKIEAGPAPKKIKNPAKLNLAYGRLQEQVGQLTEARRAYDLVLKEEPKSVDAMLGIARLDQLGGRTREAEAGFLRAAKLKPNDPHVLDGVGQYYAANEKWPEAIRWTESALTNAKGATAAADVASIEFHLATCKARSGDLPGSLPHFANSVGEAEGHFNIGYILYEKGQTAAAVQEMEQALRIRPDLAQAQALLDEIRLGQAGSVQQTSATAPTQQYGLKETGLQAGKNKVLSGVFRPAKLSVTTETHSAANAPLTAPSPIAHQASGIPTTNAAPTKGAIISADFSGDTQQPAATSPQQEQWRNQYGAGHQR